MSFYENVTLIISQLFTELNVIAQGFSLEIFDNQSQG